MTYPYHPELAPKTKKLMESKEADPLIRTYNWNSSKLEKIHALSENKKEKEEKDLKLQTAKLNYVNKKVFAVSKVKLFVDSLKNESYTHSFKRDYKDPATARALTPNMERRYKTGPLNGSVERRPISAPKKEPLIDFINLLKKDAGADPSKTGQRLEMEVR